MAADREGSVRPLPAAAATHRHDGGGEEINRAPPRGLMGRRRAGGSAPWRPEGGAERCRGNRGRALDPGRRRGHFVPQARGDGDAERPPALPALTPLARLGPGPGLHHR